jgi:2''-aminoglycoside nucleotidyltransferase
MNTEHIELIYELLQECDLINLPLWLESGWAIDARLRRITREHQDLDLAIPAERMDEFKQLLVERGAVQFQETDYGFLVQIGNRVSLDCEPCFWNGEAYEIEGMPPGSCPMEKQGMIAGVPLRCVSWPSILYEYLFYQEEVPFSSWPAKDKASYRLVQQAIGEKRVAELRTLFGSTQSP